MCVFLLYVSFNVYNKLFNVSVQRDVSMLYADPALDMCHPCRFPLGPNAVHPNPTAVQCSMLRSIPPVLIWIRFSIFPAPWRLHQPTIHAPLSTNPHNSTTPSRASPRDDRDQTTMYVPVLLWIGLHIQASAERVAASTAKGSAQDVRRLARPAQHRCERRAESVRRRQLRPVPGRTGQDHKPGGAVSCVSPACLQAVPRVFHAHHGLGVLRVSQAYVSSVSVVCLLDCVVCAHLVNIAAKRTYNISCRTTVLIARQWKS